MYPKNIAIGANETLPKAKIIHGISIPAKSIITTDKGFVTKIVLGADIRPNLEIFLQKGCVLNFEQGSDKVHILAKGTFIMGDGQEYTEYKTTIAKLKND